MLDFTYHLMNMQALFSRQLMHGLEQSEISVGQPKVLAYLKSHEGKCQKDIAQACHLEPGSLTVLLTRMEKLGMVERRSEGGNRKTRYVYLTDYGRQLAEIVVARFFAVEEAAFAGISEEEQEFLFRICGRVLENLQKDL